MRLIVLVDLRYARLLQPNPLLCQAQRALASTFPSAQPPMLLQRSLRHLQPVFLEIHAQRAFTNAALTITVGAAASGVIAASPHVLRQPQRRSWIPMELLSWLLQDQASDPQAQHLGPVAVQMDGSRARRVMEEAAVPAVMRADRAVRPRPPGSVQRHPWSRKWQRMKAGVSPCDGDGNGEY